MYKWWKAISSSIRIGIIVGIAVVIVVLSYVYNSTNSNLVLGIWAVFFAALIVTIVFEVKFKKEKQTEKQKQLKAEARERQSKGIVSPQAPVTYDPVYRIHVKSGKFQCLVDDAWRYIGDADFNALEKDNPAIIRHEPTVDHPNRANVYIEGIHVGVLPEVYSEGLRQDYGDYYGFNGRLIRKGTDPVPGSIERYFLTIEILLKDPLPVTERKPHASAVFSNLNKSESLTPTAQNYSTITKKESLVYFPDTYVVVDVETTGLSPSFDKIIEIGAIKVENGNVTGRFCSLINPRCEISKKITDLTGITNEMVLNAPYIENVISDFEQFAANHYLVGHNVSFDFNFLAQAYARYLNKNLNNDRIDTLRLSRTALPELKNHKLVTLCNHLHITQKAHRAEGDCLATFQLFEFLRNDYVEHRFSYFLNNSDFGNKLLSEAVAIQDPSSFYAKEFNQKKFVFSGRFKKIDKIDAIRIITNAGGIVSQNLNKTCDYLIHEGENITGNYSKAVDLISQGVPIKIISESAFIEMVKSLKL